MAEHLLLHPQTQYNTDCLTADLISATIEAGRLPQERRITPYTLIYEKEHDIVYDPRRGRIEIMSMVTTNTDVLMSHFDTKHALKIAMLEIHAFKDFRDVLITQPDHSLALWMSPPTTHIAEGGYDEGRLTIGYIDPTEIKTDNQRVMKCYTFPIMYQSTFDYTFIANRLAHDFDLPPIRNPEELRSRILNLLLGADTDPWQLLQKYFGYDNVWGAIRENEPIIYLDIISRKVKGLAEQTYSRFTNTSSMQERVLIIKELQASIERLGYHIDVSQLPCASIDTQIVGFVGFHNALIRSATASISQILSLPILEETDSTFTENGKFIRKCGKCKKRLNRYMKKGDYCPYCNGEYKGC